MNRSIYEPVLDALADLRPKTVRELESAVRTRNIGFAQLVQAVIVLAGTGQISSVQHDDVTDRARTATARLNNHLCRKARASSEVAFLASPITGGGINVTRFQQLFLLALAEGRNSPLEWAQSAWDLLTAQGHKLVKDGKTLETAEENLVELCRQAEVFSEKRLPVLKALQVA